MTLEELESGLRAVAAPIRARDGEVVAALSASGPVYRSYPRSSRARRRSVTGWATWAGPSPCPTGGLGPAFAQTYSVAASSSQSVR